MLSCLGGRSGGGRSGWGVWGARYICDRKILIMKWCLSTSIKQWVYPWQWHSLVFLLWPHGTVIVQEIRQVIRYQILSGHTQVHWVPVLKLLSQFAKRGKVGSNVEYVSRFRITSQRLSTGKAPIFTFKFFYCPLFTELINSSILKVWREQEANISPERQKN